MHFDSIFAFLLSLFFLRIYLSFAGKLGFLAIPDTRSSHIKATVSSSGIAFFTAVFIVLLFTDFSLFKNYSMAMLGVLLVFLLGVADDLKNYPARYKLYVITVAAILSSWDGLLITNIGTYFGYSIPLAWMAVPFTVFAILGFTNALNLIDGLDGLAGTISIIILSGLWIIGYQNNDPLLTRVTTLIIPALLAFLVFNWNPAKMFMGDSGSLTLGFIISLLTIKAVDHINPIVALYLVAIPLIDTFFIMARRKKYHQPIFAPCKNHIHHIFLNLFDRNEKLAVIVLSLIQLLYTLSGIFLVSHLPQEITLTFFLLNIVIWYFALSWMCEKHPKLTMKHHLTEPDGLE